MFVFLATWKYWKIEIWRPAKIHYFLITNPFEQMSFPACRGGDPSRPQMIDFHWDEWNWIEIELKLNWSWIEMPWIEFDFEAKWIDLIWTWNEIELHSNWSVLNWCCNWYWIQLFWIAIDLNWNGLNLNGIEMILIWFELILFSI